MAFRIPSRRTVLGALGQGLLIFVGITAAIWFENRNDHRRERAVEIEIMSQMVADLQSDTADLAGNLTFLEIAVASADTVLAALNSEAPWDPSLAAHFGWATGMVIFLPSRAAYQHLISSGLDVIEDGRLRLQITKYYEFHALTIASVEAHFVTEVRREVIRPEMRSKFVPGTVEGPAQRFNFLAAPVTPIDFEALRGDHEFRNALMEYGGGLETQAIISNLVRTAAAALIGELEGVLNSR